MSRTYNADEVDALVQDCMQAVTGALEVAEDAHKQAAASDRRAAEERQRRETLEAQQVTLQRVAAVTLDPKLVDETMETLEDLAFLDSRGREKIAGDLTRDPNNALILLSRIAALSADAPQQGKGVPKSASARTIPTNDPDGWGNVIRNGA